MDEIALILTYVIYNCPQMSLEVSGQRVLYNKRKLGYDYSYHFLI